MKSLLIHAWNIYKENGVYYLPYTHWVYLNEIAKKFDKVCLLSPTLEKKDNKLESLQGINGLIVEELPPIKNYLGAIKYFFIYLKKYNKLKLHYNNIYARYPVPFGWMQKVFFKKSNRIIHYVGDPINTTKTNTGISTLKKSLLLTLFLPENALYNRACRGARVYTNGFQLAERLTKKKIDAHPVISTTLNPNDYFFDIEKTINSASPQIIYIGYLRPSKGVEVIIKAFKLLQKDFSGAKLSIVGDGEYRNQLETLIATLEIKDIRFLGHIDDREILNKLLRKSDVFCFASLSEGSPRVILEAMANGLNVVSTPVGSLPKVFEDKQDILFAEFNNAVDFYQKMKLILTDDSLYKELRSHAFKKVKNYSLSNFINTIFR